MTPLRRFPRASCIPMPSGVSRISRAYVGLTVVTTSAKFIPVFNGLITPRARSAASSLSSNGPSPRPARADRNPHVLKSGCRLELAMSPTYGRVQRHEGANVVAQLLELLEQGPCHVGKSAGFCIRHDLRTQDAQL